MSTRTCSKHNTFAIYQKTMECQAMEVLLYTVYSETSLILTSHILCSSHILYIHIYKNIHTYIYTYIFTYYITYYIFSHFHITPVLERKCTLCSLNSIEDEVHFLIVCPFYSQPRSQLFSFLNCRYSTFKFLSSHEKFIYVLGSRDPAIINQTSQYISKATQLRLAYLSPPI